MTVRCWLNAIKCLSQRRGQKMTPPLTQHAKACFLSLLLNVVIAAITDGIVCHSPNLPAGGDYTPKRQIYEPGDVVTYQCLPHFKASQEETSIRCKDTGIWTTDGLIFCDEKVKPEFTKILPKDISPNFNEEDIFYVIDGDRSTCLASMLNTKITWAGYLWQRFSVSSIRIYLPRGERYQIEAFTKYMEKQTSCGMHKDNEPRRMSEWVTFKCPEDTLGDIIYIKDWARWKQRFQLCEVEIFAKIESYCDPPSGVILNGHLIFNRTMALLECRLGFRPIANNRSICHEAGWNYSGLLCSTVLKKNNTVIIAVSVAVVLASLAVILILIFVCLPGCKKSRTSQSVVTSDRNSKTFNPDAQRYSTNPEQRRVSFSTGIQNPCGNDEAEDHEYSTVRYSGFLGKVLLPLKIGRNNSDSD